MRNEHDTPGEAPQGKSIEDFLKKRKRYTLRVVLFEEIGPPPKMDEKFDTAVVIPVAVGRPLFNNGIAEPPIDLRTEEWVGAEGLQFGKFNEEEVKDGVLPPPLFPPIIQWDLSPEKWEGTAPPVNEVVEHMTIGSVEEKLNAICAAVGVPKAVFMGSGVVETMPIDCVEDPSPIICEAKK